MDACQKPSQQSKAFMKPKAAAPQDTESSYESSPASQATSPTSPSDKSQQAPSTSPRAQASPKAQQQQQGLPIALEAGHRHLCKWQQKPIFSPDPGSRCPRADDGQVTIGSSARWEAPSKHEHNPGHAPPRACVPLDCRTRHRQAEPFVKGIASLASYIQLHSQVYHAPT